MDERKNSENYDTNDQQKIYHNYDDLCVLKAELSPFVFASEENPSHLSKKSTIFQLRSSPKILNRGPKLPLTLSNLNKVRDHVNLLYMDSELKGNAVQRKKAISNPEPLKKKDRYTIKSSNVKTNWVRLDSSHKELVSSKGNEISQVEKMVYSLIHTHKEEIFTKLESTQNTGTIKAISNYTSFCFVNNFFNDDFFFTKVKLYKSKHYSDLPLNKCSLQEMDLRGFILTTIMIKFPLNNFHFISNLKKGSKLKNKIFKSDAIYACSKLCEPYDQCKTLSTGNYKFKVQDTSLNLGLLHKVENINEILRRKIKEKDCLIEHLQVRLKELKEYEIIIAQSRSVSTVNKRNIKYQIKR